MSDNTVHVIEAYAEHGERVEQIVHAYPEDAEEEREVLEARPNVHETVIHERTLYLGEHTEYHAKR